MLGEPHPASRRSAKRRLILFSGTESWSWLRLGPSGTATIVVAAQSSRAHDIPATSGLMSRHQRAPGLSSFSG